MKRFLNYLNTLIVFAALACFPIVLSITYQFDRETSNKLDQINQLFLKIDESNQKQLMFHKSEYSHYVLITSEEYTEALSDVIICYEKCLEKMELSDAEYKERQKNLKIFKAAQAHRLEILHNINKEYAERMLQIKNLIDKNVTDAGKDIIQNTPTIHPAQVIPLTSEIEKIKAVPKK